MHIKFTLLTTLLFLLIPQAQATTWSYNSASLRNAPAGLVYSEGVDNVAQYRDRLYVDKLSFFGEKQLETITLDSPGLVINSRLSAGKSHSYFIRQFGDVQVFTPAGTLHIRNNAPDYDDRYVYTWSRSQLYRRASGCPQESRFDTDAEGDSKLTLVDQCLKNSGQDGL